MTASSRKNEVLGSAVIKMLIYIRPLSCCPSKGDGKSRRGAEREMVRGLSARMVSQSKLWQSMVSYCGLPIVWLTGRSCPTIIDR